MQIALACARSVFAVWRGLGEGRVTHLVAHIAIIEVAPTIANLCPTAKLLEVALEAVAKLEGLRELIERFEALHVVDDALWRHELLDRH